METVPENAAAVVGANFIENVSDWPAEIFAPVASPDIENPFGTLIRLMVSTELVRLVTRALCVFAFPTAVLPKLIDDGLAESWREVLAACNCTRLDKTNATKTTAEN